MKNLTPIIGKTVRVAMRLRGGGSALPGLVIEKIDTNFVYRTLSQLPHGVVVVSGTNGKTTTTKIVVELLQSQGLRVFTNKSGSNFVRGVAASLIADVNLHGKLNADIAVLELDEAHAVHFVRLVQPRYSLLLNVMRDQLDRFGEIDTTANMLRKIADATTETVVVNREDPRLRSIGESLSNKQVSYFGLHQTLRDAFPNDDDLHSTQKVKSKKLPSATVLLSSVKNSTASFSIAKKSHTTDLQLSGVYNIYNAAAALALVHTILPEATSSELTKTLADIQPAFGRGERFIIDGQLLEIVLVKNPAGFRLALESFAPDKTATLIAINDNYADGRDMSWLWDVDFSSLHKNPVAITGIRAYDMALRLAYDEVQIDTTELDIAKSLKYFIAHNSKVPKRIFCTYTAMLELRKKLKKYTNVERAL